MGRPKGSKSKSHEGYTRRTLALKERYGSDIFKVWGKKGGNPVLLKSRADRDSEPMRADHDRTR